MGQIALKLIVIVTVFVSSQTWAMQADHLMWHKRMLQKATQQRSMLNAFNSFVRPEAPAPAATEATFDQILNPDDPVDKQTTFKQHYFVDSTYATLGANSPVILFLCGEWDCSALDFEGMAYQASRIHAQLISLEHRYYGQSQPFTTYTPDTLKYLKTRYAVDDIARFENYAQKSLGFTGPWIVVGGSYSANLAAYYREKYPQLVVGALASSGPVLATANFYRYDAHVAGQLGATCLSQVQSVVKQLEAAATTPQTFAQAETTFQASQISDPVDFLEVVADMVAGTVQYGTKDDFCNQLAGATTPAQLLSTYATAGLVALGETAFEDSVQFLTSTSKASDSLAWMWQTCTEYGYWQTANSDPSTSARSSQITIDFYNKACSAVFGLPPVNTDVINANFFAPLDDSSETSKILFVNGTMDPWSEISIRSDNNVNRNLSTYTVTNGSHCSDIDAPTASDSASLQGAHDLFGQMIDQWLAGN